MVCGGLETRDTCLQLVDGVWTISHNLKTSRVAHTSWTTADGVLLIGGSSDQKSTEPVKTNGTTEVGTLTLKYKSRYYCG